jgi:hypothetical protein
VIQGLEPLLESKEENKNSAAVKVIEAIDKVLIGDGEWGDPDDLAYGSLSKIGNIIEAYNSRDCINKEAQPCPDGEHNTKRESLSCMLPIPDCKYNDKKNDKCTYSGGCPWREAERLPF